MFEIKFRTLAYPMTNTKKEVNTVCEIKINGKKYLSYATLYYKDKPNKVLGQKYALKNTIKTYGRFIPKDVRRQMWDWFFNHSKAARRLSAGYNKK